MIQTFSCLLCSKIYDTKRKLQSHERSKHKNNKLIPHRHILFQPSNEILSLFRDTVIIRLKKSLGFSRHSIGKKCISIDAFPENVFLSLFENEDSFNYIPSQRKYQCILEGMEGEERLKSIFKYDQIIFRENTSTSTRGYILFEDSDSRYKVIFNWKQKELKENARIFLCGTLSINFTADSGEFINDQENHIPPLQPSHGSSSNNDHTLHTIYTFHDTPSFTTTSSFIPSNNKFLSKNKPTFSKSHYRYILPRPPFQSLNNSHNSQ